MSDTRSAPTGPARAPLTAGTCDPVNPFATRTLRPGALPYLFTEAGQTPQRLAGQLLNSRPRAAAIIGPHGTGKSTLLAALRPHLQRPGHQILDHRLHAGGPRRGPLADALAARPDDLIIIDGFEQLPAILRYAIVLLCRLRHVGLLVTSHRPMRGLTPLLQTSGSLATASHLLDRLMIGHAREKPFLLQRLHQRWPEFAGNVREALFAMYDEFENLNSPSRHGSDSMAPRLPVVLSQSATAGPHRDREESIVTDLLMQHGADVSIVRPLSQLAPGQTDLLMLEGLAGDFVLLAWQSPHAALAALAELGIDGVLGATPFTDTPGNASGRRIYAFDLRQTEDGQEICQAITGLLRDRQTATFSLGPPQRPLAATTRQPSPRPDSGAQARAVASPAPGGDPPSHAPAPRPASRSAASGGPASQPASDEALEALVDSLDACDL